MAQIQTIKRLISVKETYEQLSIELDETWIEVNEDISYHNLKIEKIEQYRKINIQTIHIVEILK